MPKKRLRIFAGPNGSGKTTIINDLKNQISFGVYVNADDIEQALRINKFIDLPDFGISLTTHDVQLFFQQSTFAPVKLHDQNLWQHFTVAANKLQIDSSLQPNSYIAADIAELIRQTLLRANISFTYETVMSHEGKLDFFKQAMEAGYRVYLYYIATEDPEININRVNVRIAQNGHAVDPEIIRSRYFRSLQQLKQAVKLTSRAYIFDNSSTVNRLIAEITDGKEVEIFDPEIAPNWFVKYLANKE